MVSVREREANLEWRGKGPPTLASFASPRLLTARSTAQVLSANQSGTILQSLGEVIHDVASFGSTRLRGR